MMLLVIIETEMSIIIVGVGQEDFKVGHDAHDDDCDDYDD